MADFLSVESSMFDGVAHNPETSILTVRFKNGDVYHHDGASAADFDAFVNAPSLGRHYNQFIKGTFPHTKQQADNEKARPVEAAEPDVTTTRA